MSSHGGERVCSLMNLLIRTLILLDQGPTFMTSFNLTLSPNTVTLGIGISTTEFVGDANISP